jgi:hypothetical protein
VFLALGRQGRLALAWFFGICFAAVSVVALKAAALPVSGHATVAMAFEGGFAVLMWRDLFGLGRGTRLGAAVLALMVVAVSAAVLVLGWHSVADVAVGSVLGAIVPTSVALTPRRVAQTGHGFGPVTVVIVVLLLVGFYGVRLDARTERLARLDVQHEVLGATWVAVHLL